MAASSSWPISRTTSPELQAADHETSLARIGEHLVGQLAGAHGRGLDLLHVLVAAGRRRKLPQGQIGVAQHGHEQVVEVVGDAAGEDAQALQLLGVLDLGFEPALFGLGLLGAGDVLVGAEHADDFAIGIAQGDLAGAQPDLLAVGCGLGFFVADLGFARFHDRGIIGAIEFGLFGPAKIIIGLADDLFGTVQPGIGGEEPVAAQEDPVKVLPEDSGRDGVQHTLQHVLCLAQVLGLAIVGGHVGEEPNHPDDAPGLVAQGRLRGLDPEGLAVGLSLGLENELLGAAGFDHFEIVGAEGRDFGGGAVEVGVGFAEDLGPVVQANGLGEDGVAAEVYGVAVLPEDALGEGVQDMGKGGGVVGFGHAQPRYVGWSRSVSRRSQEPNVFKDRGQGAR